MRFKTIRIHFKEVPYKPVCLPSVYIVMYHNRIYDIVVLLNTAGNPSESENKIKKLQNNALKLMSILIFKN